MPKKKKNKEVTISKPVLDKKHGKLLMWVCVAAIALITWFVFSPSLDNDFTNWDDIVYVTNNPLVAVTPLPLAQIFETPVAANYHPLTVLSLALNYRFSKFDPKGYHLVNVILHLLNTILVFFFIYLLTRRNIMMAAIVSLFFGIHPMHVESVSWVSERKDVLYVFFFMAGLISYLRFRETKKLSWYLFTFLLFILSCLSKGMAVVFPVILLLIDYLSGVKWERRLLINKIPFFIISLLFGILSFKMQQSGNAITAMKTFTFFQHVMFASYSAIMYIVRLFVPYKLSAFYPYPDTIDPNSIPLIFYLSPFILLTLLAALIYFFLKKEKELVFGLLFYFAAIALVVQFIPIGPALVPDRYSYLAYVGLLFIAAHLINKAWQSKSGIMTSMKYPFIIITIIAAVAFCSQTYSRTQVWKNSEVLWTDVIDKYPIVSEAYDHRAEYYYNNHEEDKALPDYNKAIQLDSQDRDAYYNRGLLYSGYYKKDDLAIADYTKAIEIDSAFRKAWFNRAVLYAEYGETDLAIADYTKAIKIDSGFADVYTNRGLLYLNTGKTGLAMADFAKALAIDSTDADTYNNRGLFYLRTGKNDLALADFNKAIKYNSTSAPYYYNRGLCYNAVNNFERAADDFTEGINLNPTNVELYYNMRGQCDINLQKYNEAIADFSKAIDLSQSVAGYWLNRSVAESKAGHDEQAKADALKAQQLQGK